MRIPRKLKIGAHTYTVQRGIIDKLGETNRVKNTITLDNDLTGSQMDVTLIHEILRAINNELDHTFLDASQNSSIRYFTITNSLGSAKLRVSQLKDESCRRETVPSTPRIQERQLP
jgi:hypothetical protein